MAGTTKGTGTSTNRTSRSLWHRVALKYKTLAHHSRQKMLPTPPARVTMFEELPIEIIGAIIEYLTRDELLSFRRTSKRLYAKTNAFCARKLYGTLTTGLSLQELHYLSTSLATNTQLCQAIHTLRVQPKSHAGLGNHYYWNRRKRGRELILPCDGFEDLRTLFDPHLANCRSLQIHAGDRQSDIDGPDEQLEPADALQLILLLAAETGAKFDALEVGGSGAGMEGEALAMGTHLNADRLPVSTLQESQVQAMLAGLKSMTLRLIYSDELAASGWLPALFGSFAQLRTLDVDFDMSWGELKVCQRLLRRIRCPLLENLRLARFKTTQSTLDGLLDLSSEHLSSLRFASVTLVLGTPGTYSWKEWLASLYHRLPTLAALELDLLGSTRGAVEEGNRYKSHLHFSSLAPFTVFRVPDHFAANYVIETARHQRWRCVVPLSPTGEQIVRAEARDGMSIGEGPMLEMQVSSHGWVQDDRLVLSGIRYEGEEMGKALEVLGRHAVEMSMF